MSDQGEKEVQSGSLTENLEEWRKEVDTDDGRDSPRRRSEKQHLRTFDETSHTSDESNDHAAGHIFPKEKWREPLLAEQKHMPPPQLPPMICFDDTEIGINSESYRETKHQTIDPMPIPDDGDNKRLYEQSKLRKTPNLVSALDTVSKDSEWKNNLLTDAGFQRKIQKREAGSLLSSPSSTSTKSIQSPSVCAKVREFPFSSKGMRVGDARLLLVGCAYFSDIHTTSFHACVKPDIYQISCDDSILINDDFTMSFNYSTGDIFYHRPRTYTFLSVGRFPLHGVIATPFLGVKKDTDMRCLAVVQLMKGIRVYLENFFGVKVLGLLTYQYTMPPKFQTVVNQLSSLRKVETLEYETQLRRALDEVRFWQEQLQAISEIEL